MSNRSGPSQSPPSRRRFLGALAGGVAGATAVVRAGNAAEDAVLQSLIRQQQRDAEFGQNFDASSRTVLMPKASLPTLSSATAEATESAIGQYEDRVARGGWPAVPQVERLRVGGRHPGVAA